MSTDPAVVIDAGSGYFKGGLAGEWTPSVIFDSVVGQPKKVGVHAGMGANDRYVGDEALAKRLVLDLKWPIQKGVVTDTDAYEKLLKQTFNELKVHSEEQPILIGEGMMIPDTQRAHLAELCYEKFGVRGFLQVSDAVLACYGAGLTSGLVIDFGEHKTDVVPVADGVPYSAIVRIAGQGRLNIGGAEITESLCSGLRQNGYKFQTQVEMELVREMKEKFCYVASDFEEEQKNLSSLPRANYTLPDGQSISFGFQRFQMPEAFFRPTLLGKEGHHGLPQLIADTLDPSKAEQMLIMRRSLAENCVIAGGSSCFPGMASRLQHELIGLSPVDKDGNPKWQVKVHAPEHRRFAAWYGGSLLAPFAEFISQERYEEEGAAAIALAFY